VTGTPWNDAGPAPDRTVDAVGLRCPLPVIALARAARDLPEGTMVAVRTTDPAAGPDIAAWCRMRDHDLIAQQATADGGLVSLIRIRRTQPAAAPSTPPADHAGTPPD
jgi:tRNA 2-thiouridine synthesizing protein A